MIKERKKYKILLLWDKDYKELLHGTGISGIFTILWMWLWYFITIFSARWFGAYGMWLMAMVNTIIVFWWAIAWLGMQQSVVRYINQRQAQGVAWQIRTLHIYILKIVLPFSFIVAILLYLWKWRVAHNLFKEPKLEQLITWLALLFPLIVLGNIGLEIIKGYRKLKVYHSINKIGKLLIKISIICIIYIWSKSVFWPTIALLWSFFWSFIFTIPFIIHYYKSLPEKEPISEKEILKTSLPMMITSLSIVLISQTDIFMLSLYTDTTEVWIYQTALRVASLISFGLVIVNMIVWQQIAKLYRSKSKEKLKKILFIATSISIIIWTAWVIIVTLFSDELMNLFWAEFIQWSSVLIILAIWQFVSIVAGPVWIYMNMTGKQTVQQYIFLGIGLLNIMLNLLFIPKYWMLWAAYASAISLMINNIIHIMYIRKKDQILFISKVF